MAAHVQLPEIKGAVVGIHADDMEFIVEARNELPALLAHIEALEAENGRLREDAKGWRDLTQFRTTDAYRKAPMDDQAMMLAGWIATYGFFIADKGA